MYRSVIERHHMPQLLFQIAHQAATEHRSVTGSSNQISLLQCPGLTVPPIAFGQPRAVGVFHLIPAISKDKGCRLPIA